MAGGRYQPLHDSLQDDSEKPPRRGGIQIQNYILYAFLILFLVSLCLNIFQFLGQSNIYESQPPPKTPFAQLQYNLPLKWTRMSSWNSGNETEEESAWNSSPGFQSREGIVALNDSFTQSAGLPSAQRWPWDKSKGIYFVEGVHAMHCVKYLRRNAIEAHSGSPLTVSLHHLKHCVDGLRQFVMCHADDTPRYTGRLHDQANEKDPFGGVGQPRMCRNWDKLMDWAKENSACYRWVPDDTLGFTEKDRYKSCPDGRTFWD